MLNSSIHYFYDKEQSLNNSNFLLSKGEEKTKQKQTNIVISSKPNPIFTNFTFSLRILLHIAHSLFLSSRAPSGLPRRGTVPGGRAIRAGRQSPFQGLLYPFLLAGLLPESIPGSCWQLSPPWALLRQTPASAAATCQ